MNIEEFIKNNDDLDKYVDAELEKIADCFYSFVHGFWDLDKIGYPEKHLENIVPDEYKKDGVLKKHFDIIYKLEDKLQDIEEQARKDEEGFNIDESMVTEIRNEYHDLIDDFSKKMFMYGMKFGIKLTKKII